LGAIAETAGSGLAEQMTKVLLVAPPASGGIARHVLSLARGLDRSQFEICVACPSAGSIAEEAASLGIAVFPVGIAPTPSPVKAMSAALALSRVIARGGFHLVHAHSFSASLIAGLAREFTSWPILVSSIHNFLTGPNRLGIQGAVVRMIARKADRIVTVSQALHSVFADCRGAAEKLVTIPNGIDLGEVPDDSMRDRLRADLDIPADALVAGVVARLAPQKGVLEFLDVAAQVARRVPQARFVIVGDGPLRERIAARAQSLGLGERLVLAGFRADARRLMAAFDLAVIPSLSEGFSIVAVEAMAAARPVAAYATGGLPEVVADGRTGLLAPERDADALAAAIEALLTDPVRAREMGEAGRERTRECFSLSAMIERIQNLYADLVRSHLVGQPGQGSKRP